MTNLESEFLIHTLTNWMEKLDSSKEKALEAIPDDKKEKISRDRGGRIINVKDSTYLQSYEDLYEDIRILKVRIEEELEFQRELKKLQATKKND